MNSQNDAGGSFWPTQKDAMQWYQLLSGFTPFAQELTWVGHKFCGSRIKAKAIVLEPLRGSKTDRFLSRVSVAQQLWVLGCSWFLTGSIGRSGALLHRVAR